MECSSGQFIKQMEPCVDFFHYLMRIQGQYCYLFVQYMLPRLLLKLTLLQEKHSELLKLIDFIAPFKFLETNPFLISISTKFRGIFIWMLMMVAGKNFTPFLRFPMKKNWRRYITSLPIIRFATKCGLSSQKIFVLV